MHRTSDRRRCVRPALNERFEKTPTACRSTTRLPPMNAAWPAQRPPPCAAATPQASAAPADFVPAGAGAACGSPAPVAPGRTAAVPRKYEQLVDQWAQTYNLDPLLVDAFIRTESGFDPVATSSVDARGLMQMTEETFLWLRSKIAADEDLALQTCTTRTRASASGATCICVWNATTVMWPPLQPPTTAAGALWTICCGWKSTRPTARRCRASTVR